MRFRLCRRPQHPTRQDQQYARMKIQALTYFDVAIAIVTYFHKVATPRRQSRIEISHPSDVLC
jgi:hypothetical protein